MFFFIKNFFYNRSHKIKSIDPDEVFLDATNIPSYDKYQFEGRIEKPIGSKPFLIGGILFLIIILMFIYRAVDLQIVKANFYSEKSKNNLLRKDIVFAHRGVITDRNDIPLSWNELSADSVFPVRRYIEQSGFGTLLGFVKYPRKDSSGFFYETKINGQDGLEKYFDEILSGTNGVKLTEVNATGEVESQSILEEPISGEKLSLSIDASLQERLYHFLSYAVDESGFEGGAGVIMDAKTGEVLAISSYPEYKSSVLTEGKDSSLINFYFNSKRKPSLDRAISGLYAPGSIVKPYISVGVLEENIISPNKKIESKGSISIPNPYDPSKKSIFKDWKVHGFTDMREALAVSSDVYFYAVGGGYADQKGLGITKLDKYFTLFKLGIPTTGALSGPSGNIPTPEWKKETFNGEEWTLGNTYHTSIGQYGFQVTPLQIARAMTGIANKGKIVEPVIRKDEQGQISELPKIDEAKYNIVHEGMRLAVTNGTAGALLIPGLTVAAKTGTAEVGARKQYVNSWVEGFFPYENPKYTFAVVLEQGPPTYKVSAMRVMGSVLNWITTDKKELVNTN